MNEEIEKAKEILAILKKLSQSTNINVVIESTDENITNEIINIWKQNA